MLEETSTDRRLSAEAVDGGAKATSELRMMFDGNIGQRGIVEPVPQKFDRVEVWCIGRQPFHMQPISVAPDGLSYSPASVSWQAVPQQHNPLAPMATQSVEETDQMGAANSPTLEAQQPAESFGPRRAQQQTDCRPRGPTERLLDDRGLASGCPGGANRWSLGESRLVEKSQIGPQASGLFLTLGHSLRIQRWMSCSSLSLARLIGRWRLHPRLLSTLQTWPGWYRIPHTLQMTCETRSNVHRCVEKPQEVAPLSSVASRRLRADKSKPGLRPARPAALSPLRPWRLKARNQRSALTRLTLSRLATSAWEWPWAKSRAAAIRRASRAVKSRRGRVVLSMHPVYQIVGSFVTQLCEVQ